MPLVTLNGLKLCYEIHGRGEPLVLIAGLACNKAHWMATIDGLAAHYQVLIFDNRGIGQSDAPDINYSIEDMAQDVLGLLDHLNIKKTHVLGHSMGGCIAQTIALQASERINKLILSNTLIKFNAVSSLAQLFLLHLREDKIPPSRLIEGIFPWIFSNDFLRNEEKMRVIKTLMLEDPNPQSIVGFKRQLEALLKFDSTNWYKSIQAPTLIIGGEEDILCPHDSIKLSKDIPNAQFISWPRMAHVPMIEQPNQFNQYVLRFILAN